MNTDPNPWNNPVLRQVGRSVLVVRHTRIQIYGEKPFRATVRAIREHVDGHYSFLVQDEYTGERWWVHDTDIQAD